MKIAAAYLYTLELPVRQVTNRIQVGGVDGGEAFLDVIIKLVTDTGIVGYGEGALFPSLVKQHITALKEILPALIGRDPRETARINEIMDEICPYLSYAKSPVDIACWDILAKSCNAPLYTLLGGKAQDTVPAFACVWPSNAEERKDQILRAKEAGFKIIQVKINGDPAEGAEWIRESRAVLEDTDTFLVDANTSLSVANGLKLIELTDKNLQWYWEQPCSTMEACKRLQQQSPRTLLLDENMDGLKALLKSHELGIGDVLIFKIGRIGGITKVKQIRDLAVLLDKSVRIDGYAASDIEGAAVAHVAASTPSKNLFCAYDLGYHHDLRLADDGPRVKDGRMSVPEGPGLGITVKEQLLGEPIFSC